MTSCMTASEECEKKSKEADAKKTATQIVGGSATTAAVIAGGVGTTASIGIPAAIGIGAVTAVTGVGAGYGTYKLAGHYEKIKDTFSALKSDFNELLDKAGSMSESCLMIRDRLQTLSKKIDDLNYHREKKHAMQLIYV